MKIFKSKRISHSAPLWLSLIIIKFKRRQIDYVYCVQLFWAVSKYVRQPDQISLFTSIVCKQFFYCWPKFHAFILHQQSSLPCLLTVSKVQSSFHSTIYKHKSLNETSSLFNRNSRISLKWVVLITSPSFLEKMSD